MSDETHVLTGGEGAQAFEVEFHWRNLSEYRVREKRARSMKTWHHLTPTRLSLINRAYGHKGRMMLFRLPFRSWRVAAVEGKGLYRGRHDR